MYTNMTVLVIGEYTRCFIWKWTTFIFE